ncbi:NAD(P)-dependent oxidoreductase [Chitinophaga sp. YR573]|uniref:NAD(P)-dependent oxidoreductase n=1 Tax=Chitinophaga sp. YR573 TaxID=1881040 RepID=UPI00210128B5|nr:SDR family oxidoreductase [Chitinophaga sp. YR573]
MMKLIIFGATGGTGRHLVEQALSGGHEVTAFVRDPSKIEIRHPRLRTCKGDVMDYAAVEQAIQGHEAVLSSLGSPANKIGTIRSAGTLNIIKAMKKAGIQRFICQTSLGYGDSRETLNRTPFYFKYLIVPFILKKGFADHALQEEYIRQSRLDWVIVRPGNLTDNARTGNYRHGFPANDKNIQVKISRADVADFMLKQLSDNTYLHHTPGISY